MPAYLIIYDLVEPDRNYAPLEAAIKTAPDWCKIQLSAWLILHSGPETAIRDALLPFLQPQDRLFVTETSKTWAGMNMPIAGPWLNQRGY